MKRLAPAALLLSLAGCATSSSSSSAGAAGTTPKEGGQQEKLAITNVIPFDVASCGPRSLVLTPLTAEVLTGAMLSMSPATQECFVDLQSRDGQPFDLKAKLTAAETGVTIDVTGLGASGAGKACVEAAFKKLELPARPKGSKPVVAEIPVSGGPQTVRVGDNVANDIAGMLRLAQPTLCECYAKLGTKPAPLLKAEVEVAAGGAVKVNLNATDELATCLTGKLQALKLGDAAAKLTWPLLLKNTYAAELDAAAPAALRFQQLDGMRAQRTADVLIAAGQRVSAALAFDELAQSYKKKPAKGMLEELKVKCADVATGDDNQIAAVKSLLTVLEDSQKLVLAEKAKDPQWAQVEPYLAQQVTSSTAEVVRIEEQKKNDLNACPKMKY
jgi:hypothetical protein